MLRVFFSLLTLLGLLSNVTWGMERTLPEEQLQFRRISTQDGLPSAYINTLLQRQNGFVWVGTKGGLARFDGTNFKLYQHQSHSDALPSNDVTSLLEDSNKRLWIGTSRGLVLFDETNSIFKPIELGDSKRSNTILALHQAQSGKIIVGTENGVFRLSGNGDVEGTWLEGHSIKFFESNSEAIWIGSKSGLFALNQDGLQHIDLIGDSNFDVREARLFDGQLIDNTLWLATDGDGLLAFDISTNALSRQYLRSDGLSSNSIWSLGVYNQRIWLGYFYDGIAELNPNTGQLLHFNHHPHMQHTLPYSNVSQLLFDKQGLLWVGTTNGLAVTDLISRQLYSINEYHGLTNKHVWSFARDDDTLWIGTEDGINQFDLKTKTLHTHKLDVIGKTPIWDLEIVDDQVYLATNDGLAVFRQVDGVNSIIWTSDKDSTPAYSIVRDEHLLHIGLYDGSYRVFDTASQKYTDYWHHAVPDYINQIIAFEKHFLAATRNGLYALAPDSRTSTLIPLSDSDVQPNVTSLYLDKTQLWVSTDYSGLYEFRWTGEQWQKHNHWQSLNGLSLTQVKSFTKLNSSLVVFDQVHINILNPESGELARAPVQLAGLNMEFNLNAIYNTGDSVIVGGNQGLAIIPADTLLQPAHVPPPLKLTEWQIMDKTFVSNDSPNALTLQPEHQYYAFHFTALEFIAPRQIQYQYRLLPSRKQWSSLPQGQLSLSQLPYGEYTLQVKASDITGQFRAPNYNLSLHVIAPWWQTNAAKLSLAILVLLALVFWYWRKKRQVKRLSRLANYDDLTGLPNRQYFNRKIKELMEQAKENGSTMALIFIDLNEFKQINDTLGHAAGDKVLQHIAEQLSQRIRDNDFAARLSGDEFVVLLPNIKGQSQATKAIARIRESFDTQLSIDGAKINFDGSIGVSIFDGHAPIAQEELLKQADRAMYRCKRSGEGVCFYQP
ncbi:Signaling protein YkoW [Saliniradius amylolyticus]|uniref:Signaling protein YkoW n=1 Tax=Saliniradius amylolyticus TaxID=2183582 RepID=A0A2S2E3R0_9ALTE|nr:ligand-binding sensor domain-containing diguanylate cyclase [Saliniradius amylolyticus]AWL12288.1 Signaling protein YkoW [Saliniradius amylolyticus]